MLSSILFRYPTIKKPSWNPPNWIFGPVWSVLYTLMGYASWRVWKAGGGALPLSLYAGQLVLNFMWSPLFFKVHDLRAASADITALIGLLAATILEFSKVDKLAAQLLLPYLGWTTFAAALTWNIYLNNRQVRYQTDLHSCFQELCRFECQIPRHLYSIG